MIPKTPIACFDGSIIDQDGFLLMDNDIALQDVSEDSCIVTFNEPVINLSKDEASELLKILQESVA